MPSRLKYFAKYTNIGIRILKADPENFINSEILLTDDIIKIHSRCALLLDISGSL